MNVCAETQEAARLAVTLIVDISCAAETFPPSLLRRRELVMTPRDLNVLQVGSISIHYMFVCVCACVMSSSCVQRSNHCALSRSLLRQKRGPRSSAQHDEGKDHRGLNFTTHLSLGLLKTLLSSLQFLTNMRSFCPLACSCPAFNSWMI